MAEEKPIGKVVHYYDKIGVAIIRVEKPMKVGDRIKFVKDEHVFEETIESMQVEHKQITQGKKGDEIGMKVSQTAKEGALVFAA